MPVHPSRDYDLTVMYSVSDDAWHLELELLAEQRTLMVAVVPDEDPAAEPRICFEDAPPLLCVPYEVMRWFMDQVADEVRRARGWMQLRPELVDLIRHLRQQHLGNIDDEAFPQLLAKVRASVPEEDLPTVLAAAVGRNPDGSFCADQPGESQTADQERAP